MKISSFRVTKFRNIVDSGPIEIDSSVTCLVGKNEAGKSGLLEALYLFNPAYHEEFNVDEQYPRWLVVKDRRAGSLNEQMPITVTFSLEESDKEAVASILGDRVLTGETLAVSRKYNGNTSWQFNWNEQIAVDNLLAEFPETISSQLSNSETLDQLKEGLKSLSSSEAGDELSDDIQTAQSVIDTKGLSDKNIWKRIVSILKPRLPKFFRFTGYSILPGRIDFRDISNEPEEGPGQSGIQTARALLKLAGTDIDQLTNEDYELRKGELEAVQIDLTNQVFEYWKQNPDLEVLIDVDKETIQRGNNVTAIARFLDIRLRDKRTGYSNNFSQRSSGFQWFFSFLAAFSEFEGRDSTVVLLDEPALTLHGKAQSDFLRFINDRLAPSSPVIYTTHSPFMVEAHRLERVRIIEDHGPPEGAVCHDEVMASDPDSLFPLQAALGYDIAQNLFVGPHNLVVEGTSDFIYLTVMSEACSASGREKLNELWRILPAGGATNIPTFVSLVGPHLDITVLADSDTKGMQRVTSMIERRLLEQHRLVMASIALETNQADIEDLFSEGDYIEIFNRTYGESISKEDLPAGNRIVKRIESHIGKPFNHGEVAETLLRHHHEMTFADATLDRFEKLFKAINETMS